MNDVRTALHLLADTLADLLDRERLARPVEQSEQDPGPSHSTRDFGRRRAPRMPPVVRADVDVTPENRERARQALLRRGYAVRTEEDSAR